MLTSTRPAPAPPCLPHLCLEPLDALMHAHAQRRRLCALCDVVGARRAAGGRRRSRGPGRSCSCGRRGGGVCGRRGAREEAQPICPMEVAPSGLLPRHVLLVCGCGCGPPWVRPGRAKTAPSTRRLVRGCSAWVRPGRAKTALVDSSEAAARAEHALREVSPACADRLLSVRA